MDLDKFPTSRVCQLAKKMESSKVTARHITQVAGDPQMAQINLMYHQHTELPNGKYKKKKPQVKQKQAHQKNGEQRPPNQYKKSFDPRLAHKNKDRCSKCRDPAHLEGFQCPAKNTSESMPQVLPLHKHLLPKSTIQTIQLQAQETHCASIESWYHTCT